MDMKELEEIKDRYTPIDLEKIKEINELLSDYIPLNIAVESTIKMAEKMFKSSGENTREISILCFITGFYYANVYAQEQKDNANNN